MSKKGTKISRKLTIALGLNKFIQNLIKELKIMKDHLHRAHMQYRAFKACEDAMQNEGVLTIQIDWSENAKLTQAREEKSAYYNDTQMSLHAMYSWCLAGNQSSLSLSECTVHKANGVYASLEPVLEKLLTENKIHNINIVSDSPTSQYRNKSSFWYMLQFAMKHDITIKWIYLEANHGKGVPDGIGGDGKRAIADIIRFNPDKPFYTVNDIFDEMCESLPSIEITTYTEEDVKEKASLLPQLKSIDGTAKCHEVTMISVVNGEHQMVMKENSDQEPSIFKFVYEKKTTKVTKVAYSKNVEDTSESEDDDNSDKG